MPVASKDDPEYGLVAEQVVSRRAKCRLAFLAAADVTRFLTMCAQDKATSVLAAPAIATASGQECFFAETDATVPLVTGAMPVSNGDAYDPVVESFHRGMLLRCISEIGTSGHVRLRFLAEYMDVNENAEQYTFTRSCKVDPNSPDRMNQTIVVQTPETRVSRIKGTVTLSVGSSVAIDGLRRTVGGKSVPVVLLLSVVNVGKQAAVSSPITAKPSAPVGK
jgi:type II secretory pathway component GspD/PulD (secretin)